MKKRTDNSKNEEKKPKFFRKWDAVGSQPITKRVILK